eukprot:95410-Amphidinium_carterae.1
MAHVRGNRKRARAVEAHNVEDMHKAKAEIASAMVITGGQDSGTSSLLGTQPPEGTALAAPAVMSNGPLPTDVEGVAAWRHA